MSDEEQEQVSTNDPPYSSILDIESHSEAPRYDKDIRLHFNVVRDGYVVEGPVSQAPASCLFGTPSLSFGFGFAVTAD